MSIRRADQTAVRRRTELIERRQTIYLVDRWLNGLESLMERGEQVVPEPLFADISGFVEDLDADVSPPAHGGNLRATSRMLDVLFEAQTYLLLRLDANVWHRSGA